MKKLLLTLSLFLTIVAAAAGQQKFSTTDFKKRVGKTGTLCDTVYTLRIVSDTLTLLNMGGSYPNQSYTIAIKGNKITLDWTKLKGKFLCVTGVFEYFKDRPEIVAAQPDQIDVH